MTVEALEGLFEVEDEHIVLNSIHAIKIGSMLRMMIIGYDTSTHKSTWMSPGVSRPFGTVLDSRSLSYQPGTSGKRYLCFRGGEVAVGDISYESLSTEQRRIHDNWDAEVEKAGFGGVGI